jgi:polysaccharide biosynthesis transport protein
MDLRHYLTILGRRKRVILITLVLTLIVTIAGTLVLPRKYQASTTLRVATAGRGYAEGVGYDDVTYADRLMLTYSKIAVSEPVLTQLTEKLGLAAPPKVDVEIVANTELMKITVENKDPVLAKNAANTLTDILINDFRDVYTKGGKTAQEILSEQIAKTQDELSQARAKYDELVAKPTPDADQVRAARQIIALKEDTYNRLVEQYEQSRVTEALRAGTVSIAELAVVPKNPSEPQAGLNIALGLLIGLMGGIGMAFLFENLDTKLYTVKQIEEATELAVTGKIPYAGRMGQERFFINDPRQEEAFRRLRTNLFTIEQDPPLRTLLVTSAEPGEGKSTVVVNLARAIAQSGRMVIVVDCDLRAPTMHKAFGLSNDVGLSDVLQYQANLEIAVRFSNTPGVFVLTSGTLPPNPAEMVGSSHMTALIRQLAQQFDVVLLDTPALLAVTDAAVLAPAVDGVLLVVRRAQAQQEAVHATREQLANVKARLVGLVVNGVEQDHAYYYYHQTMARKRAT